MATGSRVAEILFKARILDELQARSALARQEQWGGRLGKHVVEMGFATESAVVEALARATGLQRIELGTVPRDAAALAKIDVRTAEERGVFPYALRDNGKTLYVAMADPTDLELADFLAARCGCRVRVAVAGEREIIAAIYNHYKNEEPPAGLMGGNNRAPVASVERMELEDFNGMPLDVPASRAEAGAPAGIPRAQTPAAFAAGTPAPRRPAPGAPVAASAYAAGVAAPRARTPAAFAAATAMPPGTLPHAPTPAAAAAAGRQPGPATRVTPAQGTQLPAEALAGLPPAAAEHMHQMQRELDRTAQVLRALVELCLKKGLFDNEEFRAVIARFGNR